MNGMKHLALYLGIAAVLTASCAVEEKDFQTPNQDDVVFYASFEQPMEEGTKVYANEDLLLRWTADDRVSIFNKITYNQQYKFTGETGDNAGGFRKVDTDEFITGNEIPPVVSVYPYKESTKISNSEILTVTLPAEQSYAQKSFGLGDNTMVAVSSDNLLQYKNVGGFLMLKLYGEGVSVSSITLKGNNAEKLAGKASVIMPVDGVPSATMSENTTTEITLNCPKPVQLGATAEEYTQFWFVVPPTTFSKGFTILVNETTGGSVEKSTQKSIVIERSKLTKMSPFEVEYCTPSRNIEFADQKVKDKLVEAFDTNKDGELSYEEAAAVTSIEGVFGAIKTYRSFDEFQYFINVKKVPYEMFYNWNLLTSVTLPNSIEIIDGHAFQGCVKLSHVSLSDHLVTIKNNAFYDCTSLTEISIPESVTTIDTYAFYNCEKLASPIVFPQGLKELGALVFYNCKSIPHVTFLGNNLTNIGSGTFQNCSSIDSVVIPEGVTAINYDLFHGCSSLASVVLPSSVRTISGGAFCGCTSLSSIVIPEEVTYLSMDSRGGSGDPFDKSWDERGAFENCTSLKDVTLGSKLQYLGPRVFYNCIALESITFKYWVSNLAQMTFYGCSNLRSVNIPDSVSSIGPYCFSECPLLSEIILPDSITIISRGAFQNCTSLRKIIIPDSVTEIRSNKYYEGAFSGCSSLTYVELGIGVESIGMNSFSECDQLTMIVSKPTSPPVGGNNMFRNTNNCPIFVPAESLNSYQSAQYWHDYADRIQSMPSAPVPEAVDLGLPSGLKWASFNLGASKPEEYGDYYAWGETTPYYEEGYAQSKNAVWKSGKSSGYAWSSYKWCAGSEESLTKYNSDGEYGIVDNKSTLELIDDAARVNLGAGWRIATYDEWSELKNRDNCTWTWTTENGVKGYRVTSKKEGYQNNSIFLPAAGSREGTDLYTDSYNNGAGSMGKYWSSTLLDGYPSKANLFYFYSTDVSWDGGYRYRGISVRPVYTE